MAFSGSQKTRYSHSSMYTRKVGSFTGKATEGFSGRVMFSLAGGGGLVSKGGIAGKKGGLAG